MGTHYNYTYRSKKDMNISCRQNGTCAIEIIYSTSSLTVDQETVAIHILRKLKCRVRVDSLRISTQATKQMNIDHQHNHNII